jgi:hypothetical protein
MRKSGVAYDSDGWNLDGLMLNLKFSDHGIGKVLLKKVDGVTPSWRVGLFPNLLRRSLLLILRPHEGVLQAIEPNEVTATDMCQWHPTESVDMFIEHRYIDRTLESGDVVGRIYDTSYLYLLHRSAGKIDRYKLLVDQLVLEKTWPVRPYELTPMTRIAVASPQRGRDSVAYVGPCKGGQFISVDLTDHGRVEEFNMKVAGTGNGLKLGGEVHLCVDNAHSSLLIADTVNHLIFEVGRGEAEVKIICGTGERGDAPEGVPASGAKIDTPRALAIYRPFEMIDKAYLQSESVEWLNEDLEKVRPRTIIFADSGNFKVKKIVDVGDSPEEQMIYTLLGNGHSGRTSPDIPVRYWDDLRTFPINRPFDLAVSNLGELLVACAPAQYLILLRPATTILRESAYMAGLGDSIHVS